MDQNVVTCGKSTNTDIIVQLVVNNYAEDGLSRDEENKEIQEMPLTSVSESVVHMHEVQCFFEGQTKGTFPLTNMTTTKSADK